MTRDFVIDPGWPALLDGLGLRAADLLRAAALPEDLFARVRPRVDAEGFGRLWDALAAATGSDAPGLAIGGAVSAEGFDPPVFAGLCSPDLASATARLSLFKPLTGPLVLASHDTPGGLELTFDAEPGVALPEEYVAAELVFPVDLARLATRAEVRPIAVEMRRPPASPAYEAFFGHRVREGPFNRVVFSREDARRPFLSPDPALFAAFEPALRVRPDELAPEAGIAERLRAVLMEALPSGRAQVGQVARRLGTSPRSLQRRLSKAGTSFQSELRQLRQRLAEGYLGRMGLSSAETALLLGYDDPNSFIRAFHDWTGHPPGAWRRSMA